MKRWIKSFDWDSKITANENNTNDISQYVDIVFTGRYFHYETAKEAKDLHVVNHQRLILHYAKLYAGATKCRHVIALLCFSFLGIYTWFALRGPTAENGCPFPKDLFGIYYIIQSKVWCHYFLITIHDLSCQRYPMVSCLHAQGLRSFLCLSIMSTAATTALTIWLTNLDCNSIRSQKRAFTRKWC